MMIDRYPHHILNHGILTGHAPLGIGQALEPGLILIGSLVRRHPASLILIYAHTHSLVYIGRVCVGVLIVEMAVCIPGVTDLDLLGSGPVIGEVD